jgi:foldase protein PrsA
VSIRTIRTIAAVALVAVALAACGGADVAATVNGDDITMSDITELRPVYADAARASGATFRQDLSTIIFQEALLQGLEDDFGITYTEADIDARLADPSPQEAEAIEGLRSQGTYTEEVVRRQVLFFMLTVDVREALAGDPDLIAGLLAADPDAFVGVCVRHILVGSEAEAVDVIARLDAGEDFAAVADDVSTDTIPGGDLGCRNASVYDPAFADAARLAAIGEVTGPVESSFGWHVIVVDSRTQPTADEVAADPLSYVPQQVVEDAYGAWFNDAIRAADISVSPRIGSWDTDANAIRPPGE